MVLGKKEDNIMSNQTYDFLKRFVLPVLTGFGTFCLTVGEAWNIPHYKEIAITFGALATFLAYVLNESSKQYMKDKEIVSKEV